MTDFYVPNTFIPGTKAKAQDVNANFTACVEAINQRALLNGDNTKTFSVADATATHHAVNKGQFDNLSTTLTAVANTTGTNFCVKSGNLTDGKADLLTYTTNILAFKVGGNAYPNVKIVNAAASSATISSVSSINITTTCNIFLTLDGTAYALANNIYVQNTRPELSSNDVWLNTAAEPFQAVKYNGTSDEVFNDVPIGKVTVTDGLISRVDTFPYNANGYNLNMQNEITKGSTLALSIIHSLMPDYLNGVNKTRDTVYTAPSDGWLNIRGDHYGTEAAIELSIGATENSLSVVATINNASAVYMTGSFIYPIPKGFYYKITGGYSNAMTFYPCLGV